MVEIASFLAISISNYWIYGQLRDGDPVHYDPYALYLEGVRPTANNPAPGKSQMTVWLFGGSSMRGACDHDSRTIPSYLAKIWNRQEPNYQATMVNCGQDGFNSLMETKYLQKRLIENPPPKLLIFYDGANDCAYFAQDRTPDAHQGYDRLRGMIEDYHRSFFGLLKPLNAAMWSSFTREIMIKCGRASSASTPMTRRCENLSTVASSATIMSIKCPPPLGRNSCSSGSLAGGRRPSPWLPQCGPMKT